MNTNQGTQFTSAAFLGLSQSHGIQVSMAGRGAWRDNVFIERLRWSVKHEKQDSGVPYENLLEVDALLGVDPKRFALSLVGIQRIAP